MISGIEALKKLREGNARFVDGQTGRIDGANDSLRNELLGGQAPFAVILGCSDSRVPVEIVFDQTLGDLFVIRVAGNVVAPSQIGSVEFAAEAFGTRLVVVMGHSNCGAVTATLDSLKSAGDGGASRNLLSIVERIRPSVEELTLTSLKDDPEQLIHHAVRANVRASVSHLKYGSKSLEQLTENDGLLVVGAEYSLKTGEVEFFDNVPEEAR